MRRLNVEAAIAISAAVLGAVFGQPGSGRAAGAGPVNTAPPTIWGAAQEGQTLNASKGGWSGGPTAYAYAWSLCVAGGGSCAPISGATGATYKPVTADVGKTVRVTVTAKNDAGSTQATSAPSAVISGAAAPTNTATPTISGSLQVGSTLTASKGTWSGAPTSYALTWLRCDPNGDSCAAIDGAKGDTYTVTAAAAGRTFRLSVVATNAAGSTTVITAATASVPASNGCPAGTGTVHVGDLQAPARLMVDKAVIRPRLVTLGTHTIQLGIRVTACHGRPVEGATVFAVPIPYNQFAGNERPTGADGTVTITETRQSGFPARGRRQHLLAVFVRARKPGDPLLGGVSTRRTVAFRVQLP
ncbi:MAG: hypothetical protein ACJ75G_01695 [Gaiellaceae bacterium]